MAKYEIKDGIGIIPERTSIIQSDAFRDCVELRKVVIPESVEYINPFAFFGCTNLTEFILSDSIKNIEFKDPRGVFSITESRPFPTLIPNLVDKGYSVRLKEDSWSRWD